jgi:hypothetical protein
MDIFLFFGIIPIYKLLKMMAAAVEGQAMAMRACSEGKVRGVGLV